MHGRGRRTGAGWLLALGSAGLLLVGAACGAPPPDANLLLVTLDTTRADHLGVYGYPRNTSPGLDRLARDGVVYTRAYSTTTWTLPSHASLFTGKFTASHGARMDERGGLVLADAIQGPAHYRRYRANGLSEEERTLAELLAERGFATAGIVAGPWLKRVFGLDRGFAHWDDAGIEAVRGRLAESVSDAALAWLEAHAGERFFLFLNYYDPHNPYRDPAGQAQRYLPRPLPEQEPGQPPSRAVVEALYDGEIRYMDRELARVFAWLRERGLYDDTWIIVTADHGELLGEHGVTGHGSSLFEPELRVPLIVKHPAGRARVGEDDTPIQLTDLFAMVLAGFGIELPPGVRPVDPEDPVFAEVYPLRIHGKEGDWVTLMAGDLKLHWNSRGQHRLFDLSRDPDEQHDLAAEDPERLAAMERKLKRWIGSLPPAPAPSAPREVDPETQQILRELGYLE